MTVKELKKELELYPDNMKIVMEDFDNQDCYNEPILIFRDIINESKETEKVIVII